MESRTQHGLLVLADISGFTSFMASSELDHAHDILGELLELIVQHLTPAFALVELEGDAVYVCAPETCIPRGETILELFESTYVAFKDRVQAIRRHTTCPCNACRLIPNLDLKFIASCGDYVMQSIAGTAAKPIGSDVNLVHRLAKNHVADSTGWHAYVLFPEMTLQHMGLDSSGMHLQIETIDHLGEYKTYSFDLATYYHDLIAARHIIVQPDQAHFCITVLVPAPPPIVWDWLNDPHQRSLWDRHPLKSDKVDGRRGMGTQNHCVHGKNSERLQTIMDWRPFDYFTFEDRSSTSSKPELIITHQLTPVAGGTRLDVRAKLLLPIPEALKRPTATIMVKALKIEQNYQNLARVIREQSALPSTGTLVGEQKEWNSLSN
jgi:uncharacterized protein YndB with AHSA1/START domain